MGEPHTWYLSTKAMTGVSELHWYPCRTSRVTESYHMNRILLDMEGVLVTVTIAAMKHHSGKQVGKERI